MYILALNGSHNNEGNTSFLLNEIGKHLENNGAKFEIASVHDAVSSAKIPFCVSCQTPCQKACYKNTLLDTLFKKVQEADFVIFGSPVYFGSMSAQMKAFFDKTRAMRASKAWLGKPMATVTVGATKYGGQERTAEHIQSAALVSGMVIVGNGSELGMGHFGVSAQRPANEDTYAIKQCESLADAILKYLTKE
ncbi:MAG: NAD(P)H-dependent oxidoreductase [Clostridia bacterium]|nr:NAD(P)H-dependent oxidoreductase [Clostridia bacterium]